MATVVRRNPDTIIVRKVLNYLIRKAIQGRTTTYEEIATKFKLPNSGNALGQALSPILEVIFNWAKDKKLPPLTALVVRKSGEDEGLPGQGFYKIWDTDELIDTGTILIGQRRTPADIRIIKQVVHQVLLTSIFNYYQIG